jgi:hypothetical protein
MIKGGMMDDRATTKETVFKIQARTTAKKEFSIQGLIAKVRQERHIDLDEHDITLMDLVSRTYVKKEA